MIPVADRRLGWLPIYIGRCMMEVNIERVTIDGKSHTVCRSCADAVYDHGEFWEQSGSELVRNVLTTAVMDGDKYPVHACLAQDGCKCRCQK